ncbi:conserved unknown protein [Ectocarpus siliculosus]|uniref:Serine/threonine-protein phosphatase T n=1 Tax=Ectocarpus siliculosus TaxID=2880 RepID=D7G8T7_ECTSI|nr:conserved unknown protein [Ectocarpus siliculosus]|eukprot:CBJ28105.1 conserved unknown protein [Ectocarpus siliculosus]
MSELESNMAENGGGAVAPPADVSTAMKVVTPNPETVSAAEALKLEGNALLAESKLGHAVGKYTAAIDLHPTAIYLSNRAFCYVKLEQFGLAILDADMALELDSTYVKAYYRRGSANMALAKFKLAVKDFRKVTKMQPKSKEAAAKLKASEKMQKEAAFAAAIMTDADVPLAEEINPDEIVVDSGYDGPRLGDDGEVTVDFCKAMMARFEEQKLIHKKYIVQILCQVYKALKDSPSLMRLHIPEEEGSHFTVCGDTHGQFYDVLNIFKLNGLPSAKNPYLFNGDFVDRGSFSLEVVTTFLALKLAEPEGIFLTRGNHESKNMNKIYGFEGEVKHKFDQTVMTLFAEVFCWLPLAATLDGGVFVTHGGLPAEDSCKLDDIAAVRRGREPPDSGIMSDLMWSDPQPFTGRSPSKRGVGMAFGPDVTKAFLEGNDLKLLVRSHEVKEEGYLVEHDGKCITVFSAPNYCDQMGNKGAFIRFGSDLEPQFTTFEAVPHPAVRPMAYAGAFGNVMGL